MYNVQSHAVSPACVNYAASEVVCRCLCSSRWLLHLSSANWNTVTVYWSAYRPILSNVCSQCKMLQLDSFTASDVPSALPTLWSASTGYVYKSFKVAVLTYRADATAPPYMSSELTRVADVTTRSRLKSSFTDQLTVPSHRLSTVGASAFPVAGAYIWNGFAGGCDLRSITAGVQTTPEDSSVHPQLSKYMCCLNFVFLLWQWS